MEYAIQSLAQLAELAEHSLATLEKSPSHATILGLSGDLGSGKTAFTKALAHALGVTEEVLSPTFVIAKFYSLKGARWERLIHVDAYRIEHEDELAPLRWDELIADSRNLIVVEWPELLGKHYPPFAITMKFTFIDTETRKITTYK